MYSYASLHSGQIQHFSKRELIQKPFFVPEILSLFEIPPNYKVYLLYFQAEAVKPPTVSVLFPGQLNQLVSSDQTAKCLCPSVP